MQHYTALHVFYAILWSLWLAMELVSNYDRLWQKTGFADDELEYTSDRDTGSNVVVSHG